MHEDREIKAMLDRLTVPEASANLEARIIAAAKGGEVVAFRPQRNWNVLGPRLALAASLVAGLVMFFDPAGQMTEHYLAQRDYNRYTVDGTPLLADVELVEEPVDEFDLAGL